MVTWRQIADRAIDALGVCRGDLVQIREHSDRVDVLLEMALAVERAGATPLPELTPSTYVRRLLADADLEYLAHWDRHRTDWLQQIDRVLVLDGPRPGMAEVPAAALAAWSAATGRLATLEDKRRLPYLLVAIPSSERASEVSRSLDALEAHLLPALAVPVTVLQEQIHRVTAHVHEAREVTVHSGGGAELRMSVAGRRWLSDDGLIDAEDRAVGTHVSNLPAGSIYTTVVETSPDGQLLLPHAAGAVDVRLTFRNGRITDVTAREGGDRFVELLQRHDGDRDRVSHIGIGLNPLLREFIGWPLVDEHVHGAIFVALGENRYLGGENGSSLNIDLVLPAATLTVDQHLLVDEGRIRV